MPATIAVVAQKPAPRVLTIGPGDARLIVAALASIRNPTVAEYERARDLIDLFTPEE